MRSLLIIRRIVGDSMLPTLLPGKIIVASGLFNQLSEGDLVIFTHRRIDKIKRVEKTRDSEFYVLGDNAAGSTDSRDFGWLPTSTVKARVIWPRK